MNNMDKTTKFKVTRENISEAQKILSEVYSALKEKGYNPVNQLVGYLISGDPTYITSYKNARVLIRKIERDDLVEELVKNYVSNLF